MATDVFNLQAKIGIDTSEYDKGIQGAENANKNLFNNLKSLSSVVKNAADSLGNASNEYRKTGTAANDLSKGLDNSAHSGRVTSEMAQDLAKEIDNLRQKQNESIAATNKAASEYNNLASSAEGNEQALESLADEIEKGVKNTERFAKEIAKLEERLSKESESFDENADSVEDAGEEAEKTGNENRKLGDRTKEAGEKAEKAGDRFLAFGDKIKDVGSKALSVASSIAKVGTAAVGIASAAIVKVTKDAVSAYGEYEQLVGGAQKIFDEMDYSIIAKDAANAYKELNMSASEYLESINLAGATFSQTMGDEKGYNTARKGMRAVSDYASGTGKSVAELTQKFQMITRSAGSYQSIADQFAGILPQTSADFLEQAQAAGYLSGEYKNLTEVPVAEYQEAVTNMLEKGVDALGLLGNTAKESSETLTGSFAAIKAKWQDLLVSLADPDADIGQNIDEFVDAVGASAEQTIPVIERALEGVGTLVERIAPIIAERLPEFIDQTLPSVLDAAKTLLSGFGNAIIENGPELLDAGLSILESLLSFATNINNDPDAKRKFDDFIEGIKSVLSEKLPRIISMASSIFTSVVKGVISYLPTLAKDILDFLDEELPNLIEELQEVIPMIVSALGEVLVAIVTWMADNSDQIIEGVFAIVDEVVRTLENEQIISKLVKALADLLHNILEHLPEYYVEWKMAGYNLIWVLLEGIWEGLTAHFDPVADKLSDWMIDLAEWADKWVGKAKEFIGDFLASLKDSLSGNNPIADWLSDVLLDFSSWIDERIEDIKNFGADFWESLKDSLSGNNPIADWLSDVWIAAEKAVGEWWDKVKQWGKDLVSNFIDGINDMWDSLKKTLSDYADTIADFIGFSEPKEGPLSPKGDHPFHTFAPDMVDLFVKGIVDNQDKVGEALGDTFGIENFNSTGETAIKVNNNSVLGMLDQILQAVNGGKIISIDGKAFVGATADAYDAEMGIRTQYSARGLANVI